MYRFKRHIFDGKISQILTLLDYDSSLLGKWRKYMKIALDLMTRSSYYDLNGKNISL